MIDAKTPMTEFIIYTFDKPKNLNPSVAFEWKTHATFKDYHTALAAAKQLYKTQSYARIEVIKKFFDTRKNKKAHNTIKVLKKTFLNKMLGF